MSIKPITEALQALDVYLQEVYVATGPLNQERQELHNSVVTTIHSLEDKLANVLNGSFLRGAHNLLINDRKRRYERNGRIIEAVKRTKLFGWNVRRADKTSCVRIPSEAGETIAALVLIPEGVFAIAEISVTPGMGDILDRIRFELCDPDPADFKIEDLPLCIDTVVQACAQHVRKSEKTSEETAKIKQLAATILSALGSSDAADRRAGNGNRV